jgi:protein-S-isoprenylcysteine O-methyltransferase
MSYTTVTSTLDRLAVLDTQSLPRTTDSGISSTYRGRQPSSSSRTMPAHLDTDLGFPDANNPLLSTSSPTYTPYRKDDITPYLPRHPKSLSGIALRAFCLGLALATGLIGTLAIALCTASPLWRLPFFLATLSLLHFLEFWITAEYNTRAAEVSSYLLTSNGPAYAIAHTVATVECLVTNLLWPNTRWVPFGLGSAVTWVGLGLVVMGQVIRSLAMIHAGRSFNHLVQYRRRSGHVLVTDGVYALVRHPSYFGFFWWALGTQVVMGNVVSFWGYAVVLWRFFSRRIRNEEEYLVAFFGGEYEEYRKRVRAGIPFVR